MPIPERLQQIVEAIESAEVVESAQLAKWMADSEIRAADLASWGEFNHSPSDSYGRRELYHGRFFSVRVMSWAAGDISAIHDHGHARWGAFMALGRAEHGIFSLQGEQLRTELREWLEPGEVRTVSPALIHQLGNPGHEPLLTLHIYGNHDHRCREGSITDNARLFDLQRQAVVRVDGGAFFVLPPSKITRIDQGLCADSITTLRYRVDTLSRLRQMGADEAFEQELSRCSEVALWPDLLRDLPLESGSDSPLSSRHWHNIAHDLTHIARFQRSLRR